MRIFRDFLQPPPSLSLSALPTLRVHQQKADFLLSQPDRLSDWSAETISLIPLKARVARLLDGMSLLRMLVLAEPDLLPREHAIAKIQIFARILYEEVAR